MRLTTALACLTPGQRQAIELYHLQGLPLVEVASIMNRKKGAITALMLRGTQRLKVDSNGSRDYLRSQKNLSSFVSAL